MNQENKAYIVQLVKQIVHPYFAGEIADILVAHGMTFKTEPLTNADRIRAMSDEELAKMLTVGKGAFGCFECQKIRDGECPTNCDEQCLDWLQRPAEEGAP